MRALAQGVAVLMLVAVAASSARAQSHRDPLTDREIDMLREVAPEPAPKIKLYIQFAHARMDAIEQARADTTLSPKERGRKIHEALLDLGNLVDEIGSNLESFQKRHQEMRKPLRSVISMDGDFKARLAALKQQASNPALAEEFQEYRYVLDDVLDSVASSRDLARDLLEEQNQAAGEDKDKKK